MFESLGRTTLATLVSLSISIPSATDLSFAFQAFKTKLKEAGSNFNEAQRAGVEIRTGLLDSYLDQLVPDVTAFFGKGDLVIVDLSDPFLAGMFLRLLPYSTQTSASTAVDAALLFDIALGLFVDWKTSAGKIVGMSSPDFLFKQLLTPRSSPG